jgi:hypothetical protein
MMSSKRVMVCVRAGVRIRDASSPKDGRSVDGNLVEAITAFAKLPTLPFRFIGELLQIGSFVRVFWPLGQSSGQFNGGCSSSLSRRGEFRRDPNQGLL